MNEMNELASVDDIEIAQQPVSINPTDSSSEV